MKSASSLRKEESLAQMRDVLKENFVGLEVQSVQMTESFDPPGCEIGCRLRVGEEIIEVEGAGVGMVDALFAALCARYEPEHPSLSSVRFTGFSVRGPLGTSDRNSGTDASSEAIVELTNSYGNTFEFAATSRSVTRSIAQAVAASVEYFVNAERTYVTTYRALEHYRSTGRHDLVGKYTAQLAEIVRNTSYSEVIEKMKP